jgi:hypothetical protein
MLCLQPVVIANVRTSRLWTEDHLYPKSDSIWVKKISGLHSNIVS